MNLNFLKKSLFVFALVISTFSALFSSSVITLRSLDMEAIEEACGKSKSLFDADSNSKLSPKDLAKAILPIKSEHYSLEEWLGAAKPFVFPALWEDFQNGWWAIFESNLHRPEPEKELPRMHCQLAGLIGLFRLESIEMQQDIIEGTMGVSLHMTAIEAHFPDLHERLQRSRND